MARNRKRAKERRDRRPQPVASRSRPGGNGLDAADAAPSPLEHAAPDAELADAQIALGAGVMPEEPVAAEFEPEDSGGQGDGGELGGGFGGGGGGEPPGGGGGELAVPGAVPEPRPRPQARLIGFLEGSWRELQRVQWPDRRQVMQATAVVIGFVIVAGVLLGVSDTAASHLMSYILTGH